jgi:hypothetical protein
MANYTRQRGIDFWFEFDQTFLFNRPQEVNDAIAIAYPGGNLNDVVDLAKQAADDEELVQTLGARGPGLLTLASIQDRIMRERFPDPEDLLGAFRDFGQGVLFDDHNPRPPTRLIHMMDGTPEDWVGYHRWYAFGRAALALGADDERWSAVIRNVGLAWGIQSEAEPEMDRPDNPGLLQARLDVLMNAWLNATDAALHKAFLSYSGTFQNPNHVGQVRAPAPETLQEPAKPGLVFADVRNLLDAAAGPTTPIHGGEGRFWQQELAGFVQAVVYGQPLIAPEGDERGARSALVKVLRGTLPNFPRMPLNRPALPAKQIDAIEAWIDAGCPG